MTKQAYLVCFYSLLFKKQQIQSNQDDYDSHVDWNTWGNGKTFCSQEILNRLEKREKGPFLLIFFKLKYICEIDFCIC